MAACTAQDILRQCLKDRLGGLSESVGQILVVVDVGQRVYSLVLDGGVLLLVSRALHEVEDKLGELLLMVLVLVEGIREIPEEEAEPGLEELRHLLAEEIDLIFFDESLDLANDVDSLRDKVAHDAEPDETSFSSDLGRGELGVHNVALVEGDQMRVILELLQVIAGYRVLHYLDAVLAESRECAVDMVAQILEKLGSLGFCDQGELSEAR